ncbi:MAG: DUF4013 domain-containing protein [Anaerolineales bacterium]|nr:DUF4013 domain-containing protein [Anaerolineales bacterium]
MNIGKAFSFPFEDDEWLTKLLLGAVVSAVPILNFAWTGYTVDILKNVTDGYSKPMPDWSDFGDKFVKGFFIWLAGFIYSLPAILISCLPLGLLIIPISSEISTEGFYQSDALFSAITGVGIIFLCLFVLYLLAFSFYFPAVLINFAQKGTFGSCFEIGAIIKIVSKNTSKYLTAWLVSIVGSIVIGIILMIISIVLSPIICIGWLLSWVISALASVYLFAIYAHLFGQVVAEETLDLAAIE